MTALLLAPAAGLALGLALGGRLANFAALRLRYGWAVPPALALQLVLVFAPPVPPEQGIDPLRLWLPATYVPLAACVLANRRLPGMPLILVGLAANALVIVANGGLMPTNTAALAQAGMTQSLRLSEVHPGIRLPRSKDVVLPPQQTAFWWLSDVLVSPPLPKRKVLSAGDLFVGAGMVVLVVQATRGRIGARGGPAASGAAAAEGAAAASHRPAVRAAIETAYVDRPTGGR